MDFKNRKVLVLGAGVSGISVAEVLNSLGAIVILSDSRARHDIASNLSVLEKAGVMLALGNQDERLLVDTDYVVLSPGVSINLPLVKAAQAKNIMVLSEIEVAYQICKAPIIAVTGTNGKTTTTTLIGEMVRAKYDNVIVGGNIGQALSKEVLSVAPSGMVVAEISSFQLEAAINFRPKIAAILNVTPDHLDRHLTMNTYIEMKEKIFAKQGKSDFLILNYDDIIVRQMAKKANSQVCFFSRKMRLNTGVFVDDNTIKIAWNEQIIPVCYTDELNIRGAHNVENALAACAAAFFSGVTPNAMASVLREFTGVEHRIEPVANINGVEYYNDSKATNPESAIKALEAFSGDIILIAGGRDKNTDLTDFMKLVREKVSHLILIGEASKRFSIAASQCGVSQIHIADNLESAVKLAHRVSVKGQVVLLSPACSSYDMFKNYEERGRVFKEIVKQLI